MTASYKNSYRYVNSKAFVAAYSQSYNLSQVTVGDRIKERLAAIGMSQAALSRGVGMSQPAINSLIRGASRSSTHLHKIARALGTTPEYLSGETNDPDENAPPPPPASPVQHVMLPVALPSENALARMFEGLLEVADCSAGKAALARELAQLLPIGFSQLRGPLLETANYPTAAPAAADLATADQVQQ